MNIFLSVSLVWWNLSFAAPEGGVVVGGNAAIAQSGTTTTINQTSQNAVINWQGFNLASNEAAHFIQPNSNAAALNRITSGLPTTIAGTVTANGNVFFVNPAGILFTNTSRIDVGGILATTANIQNQDFMNGNYHFTGDPNSTSSVINNGAIRSQGLVALVGSNVQNNGVITANSGKVILGSGADYTVDMYGDNLINFSVANTQPASISNDGAIYADGGQVLLTAKAASNIVDNVISMKGVIQANTVSQKNGSIILSGGDSGVVSVTGKMSAHTVKVLGKHVVVNNNAQIASDGGEVLIGGNYLGQGPEQNASTTYFGPDALIDNPNGRVIIWGTDAMQAHGTINAPGGFVETSGHWFDVSGIRVNANQWLLDPADLVIYSSASQNITAAGTMYSPDETVGTSYLNTADFIPTLNAGTNVTIMTTPSGSQPNPGNIEINAPISKTAGGNAVLNINAVGALTVMPGAAITSTAGTLDVNLTAANGNIMLGSNINANGGNVSLTAGNSIYDSNGPNTGVIFANTLTTSSGTSPSSSGGSTFLNAVQHQVSAFVGTTGAGGNITLDNGAPSGTLSVLSLSAGNVTIVNNGAIQFANGLESVAGNLNIQSNGNIFQFPFSGQLHVGGAATFDTRSAINASISLTNGNNQFAGPVTLYLNNSNQSINLTNSIATQLGVGTISGADLIINSGGAITQNGFITVPGSLTISSVGDITLDASGNNIAALNATAGSGGNFSLTNAASLTVNGLSVTGDAAITTTIGNIISNNISIGAANVNFNAAHNVNLGTSTINSGNVTLAAGNAVNNVLTGSITANTLSTTSGGMTQLGNLAISNFQGASSTGIILTNTGALNIVGISDTGFLNIANNGSIAQSGAITVTGTSDFSAGANAIDLTTNGSGNSFTGAITLSNSGANDVSLTNSIATVLAASSVGNNLTIVSGGALSQTGALVVPGTSSFSAGSNAIDLTTNGASNSFTGAITLSNSGANNVSLTNSIATVLAASSVGQDLTINSSGAITQIGALIVPGLSSFSAGANAIDLTTNGGSNIFTGAITLSNSGANNVSLTNSIATVLAASTIGQDLTLITGGALTETGALVIPGITSITASNATTDILLSSQPNDFSGGVSLGGVLSNIRDFALRNIDALATTPSLPVTIRNLTLQFDNAAMALPTTTITGDLSVTAGGAITQTGVITVPGTSLFNAGANAITLDNFGNLFTGAVSLNNIGANDVTINASYTTPLIFNTSNIGGNLFATNGSFIANTAGGDIQQIGSLHVGGVALFNLIANYASGGGNITLTDPDNTFGGYVAMFTGNPNNLTPPSTPKNASLVAAGSVFLGRYSIINGDLTVAPVNGGIYQQDSDVIAQVGVAVTGTATFNAGNNEINLGYAEPSLSLAGNQFNNFSGPVIFNNTGATNNVQFLNPHATILGASNVGGNLTVNTITTNNPNGGAISQVGALTINGTSSFNAGANAIDLSTNGASNSFTGVVSLNNSGNNNVSLVDSILLTMGASNVGSGALSLIGAGITQIAAMTVGGASNFDAGNNAITLNSANSLGGAVTLNNSGANDAVLTTSGDLLIDSATIGNNLTLNSGGAVSQIGAIAANQLTVNAVNGINLSNINNHPLIFTATNTSSGDIVFNNTDPLTIIGITQSGPGNIAVNNIGPINITTAPIASNGGAISIFSNGGTGPIFVNQLIQSGSGSGGNFIGGRSVTFGGLSQLIFGGGNITINLLPPPPNTNPIDNPWWSPLLESVSCIGDNCAPIELDLALDENGQGEPQVGVVNCVVGFAMVLDQNGNERILAPGDKIYFNEKVVTDSMSSVTMSTDFGGVMKVGPDKSVAMDDGRV